MKVLKAIDDNLEKTLCAVLLTVMVVAIFLQIVFRFAGAPLAWTEELSRYLYIWLIYVSTSLAVKLRAHIKIDILKIVFKKKGGFVLDLVSNGIFFLFAVLVTVYGGRAVVRIATVYPQTSAALHLPMWVVYASIFIGFLLVAIRLIQDTILVVKEYKAPEGEEVKEADAK